MNIPSDLPQKDNFAHPHYPYISTSLKVTIHLFHLVEHDWHVIVIGWWLCGSNCTVLLTFLVMGTFELSNVFVVASLCALH